ncbi:MAG: histidine triad nucleotide-binding protein [Firmicutes bacterium]|nr:histidine triad nucleotide-binding protein [Bacillota bacterium]
MDGCLFCKILHGEIPSKQVYEDEFTYAFHDISPQAKAHALVIPKKHVSGLSQAEALSDTELAACLRACRKVAAALGIDKSGYRVVSNCGPDACQTVDHLHFHIIGGNALSSRMA